MSHSIEREHFRVSYPLKARLRILMHGAEHDVIDCSEGGVRYEASAGLVPELGAIVIGRIRFRRGVAQDVSGRIVRVQDGAIALRLDPPGIPLSTILDEQRFLRANFPMHG